VIRALVDLAKTSEGAVASRFIPLLGVAVAVLVRLRNVDTEPVHRLPQDTKVCLMAHLSKCST